MLLSILLLLSNISAQPKKTIKFPGTPFQGTREFCSSLKPLKYKVTITGILVTITTLYNNEKPQTVKGVYRKGKLFTNNPLEKQFHVQGRLYVIYTTSFGINNLEGGDYITYDLCNKIEGTQAAWVDAVSVHHHRMALLFSCLV
jgi:hypothetical protein